jgi:hypothetical protein
MAVMESVEAAPCAEGDEWKRNSSPAMDDVWGGMVVLCGVSLQICERRRGSIVYLRLYYRPPKSPSSIPRPDEGDDRGVKAKSKAEG